MDFLTSFLISVALGAIIYMLFKKSQSKGTFPPGPFAFPIVGNLPAMSNFPHKAFYKWAETYGKMCTIALGSDKVVVLNDPVLIKEAFNDLNFSGRAADDGFVTLFGGPHGILSSSGQEWADQRRFTLRHLQDFGFGKNVMEELIMEEVTELIVTLKSLEDESISVTRRFKLVVFNSLWRIMSGRRHNHDDPVLAEILDGFEKMQNGHSPFVMFLIFFCPGLAQLFPNLSGWNSFLNMINERRYFLREAVTEHENNKPEDGQPRDFIDAYLLEIEGTSDESSSFWKQNGIRSLLAVCLDLFNAGSHPVALTLTWAFLYLTKFPECQKQIQKELDNVVGRSRRVTLADRPNLPYAEATLLEVLRYSSISPFGGNHIIHADVHFHGYHFPKDTKFVANQYYAHFNPQLWESPNKFSPERFLSADGKTVQGSEKIFAFSVGKRQCLGQSLAKNESFLFITNILQRFNVRLADDSVNVTVEPKGLFMEPEKPYSVVFNDRL